MVRRHELLAYISEKMCTLFGKRTVVKNQLLSDGLLPVYTAIHVKENITSSLFRMSAIPRVRPVQVSDSIHIPKMPVGFY